MMCHTSIMDVLDKFIKQHTWLLFLAMPKKATEGGVSYAHISWTAFHEMATERSARVASLFAVNSKKGARLCRQV